LGAGHYPVLVFILLFPLVLFVCWYVIPMFDELFKEFELPLPRGTELLLEVSETAPLLMGAITVVVIVLPVTLRLLGGRWLVDRVRIATPLVGRLWMWLGQREFAATLAAFVAMRLPLVDAVAYTREVISDRNLGRSCVRVNRRLKAGQSLGTALSQSIQFDRSLAGLAAWGEKNDLLPTALDTAAEVFDDRIEQHASLLKRLLPPLTLVIVGFGLALVVILLMLPLYQLIAMLSQY
jgi:type II secretory pathway component PulF